MSCLIFLLVIIGIMRGEAIGPVKARCPSVGECQVRKVCGGLLVNGEGKWDRGFLEG